MFDRFKNKEEFYITNFDQKRTIIQKCRIFIEDVNRE